MHKLWNRVIRYLINFRLLENMTITDPIIVRNNERSIMVLFCLNVIA